MRWMWSFRENGGRVLVVAVDECVVRICVVPHGFAQGKLFGLVPSFHLYPALLCWAFTCRPYRAEIPRLKP